MLKPKIDIADKEEAQAIWGNKNPTQGTRVLDNPFEELLLSAIDRAYEAGSDKRHLVMQEVQDLAVDFVRQETLKEAIEVVEDGIRHAKGKTADAGLVEVLKALNKLQESEGI